MSDNRETDIKPRYDIVVIGAGPGGMSVANTLAGYGLEVAVFDAASEPGGQIYQRIGSASSVLKRILGRDYRRGEKVASKFDQTVDRGDVEYHRNARVWYINSDNQIGVLKSGVSHQTNATEVVIATGCQERPMPI